MPNKGFLLAILVGLSILLNGCAGSAANPQADSNPSVSAGFSENRLKVHFIDVGQGDAILVQTPAGENMLVDAGENDHGDAVIDYLLSQGVKELAVVVGTHTHSDHIGGLDKVINRFPVQSVYMPRVTQNTKSFADVLAAVKNKGLVVKTAKAGVVVPLAGIDCRFLAPMADRYEELNEYSAVIRLEYGTQAFLLTGDAGSLPESQMLESGASLNASVLKVGHHGSYRSSTSSFLAAVAPQYGVISLGADNDYGYPHASTLNRLDRAGLAVYRTDQNGSIVFATDGNDLQISTER